MLLTRVKVSSISSSKSIRPADRCSSRIHIVAYKPDGAPDSVAKDFVHIFSPTDDKIKDWTGTGSNFSGKVSHESKKPFQADGYTAESTGAATQEAAAESKPEPVSGAVDSVARDFVHIFSPPQDKIKDWKDTATPFSGTMSRGRKPFKDGYSAVSSISEGSSAMEAVPDETAENKESAMDYLQDATLRLMGHNFKGDQTEPETGCGSEGWKGSIHTREGDGFHSKSY